MRRMKDSCRVLTLIALSFAPWGQSHKADGSDTKSEARIHPSPEMERLLNAFVGKWTVRETFEVSASKRGKTREGTATFRAGPGFSLIEDYQSNGSAGELHFLALLWWDPKSQVYPLLTCANNNGCELRGSASNFSHESGMRNTGYIDAPLIGEQNQPSTKLEGMTEILKKP
jgi:hypothetical protein